VQWKFVICPFVDEETNGSYPFAKGLAHLCRYDIEAPSIFIPVHRQYVHSSDSHPEVSDSAGSILSSLGHFTLLFNTKAE
jgi:hypothetical protein